MDTLKPRNNISKSKNGWWQKAASLINQTKKHGKSKMKNQELNLIVEPMPERVSAFTKQPMRTYFVRLENNGDYLATVTFYTGKDTFSVEMKWNGRNRDTFSYLDMVLGKDDCEKERALESVKNYLKCHGFFQEYDEKKHWQIITFQEEIQEYNLYLDRNLVLFHANREIGKFIFEGSDQNGLLYYLESVRDLSWSVQRWSRSHGYKKADICIAHIQRNLGKYLGL